MNAGRSLHQPSSIRRHQASGLYDALDTSCEDAVGNRWTPVTQAVATQIAMALQELAGALADMLRASFLTPADGY